MELQEGSREPLYQIMFARYYSSSLGRFMAVDPGSDTALEYPQSWNKYTYVRNNPLAFVDPTGMYIWKLADSIGEQSQRGNDVGAAPGEAGAGDSIRDRRAQADRANLEQRAAIVAKRVLKRYNQRSIDENREFGGLIFVYMGQISSTPPKAGDTCTEAKCEVNTWDQMVFVPAGANVIASFHTHGAPGPSGNNGGEAFSVDDARGQFTVGRQSAAFPGYLGGYLGTPGGAMYFIRADAISRREFESLSYAALEALVRERQQYLGRIGEQ